MNKDIKLASKLFFSIVLLFFVFPHVAEAHLIGGNGFASGVTHPLFGLDHLLAMVAVGIISSQIGGKAIWAVPATFVFFMMIGGLLAILGVDMLFIETGIALSVLVLGSAIALSKKLPVGSAIACVGLFALLHGHAHGEEMPAIAYPALYASGFVFSTTVFHILGVVIGHYARKTELSLKALRFSGAAISTIGLYFLLGL